MSETTADANDLLIEFQHFVVEGYQATEDEWEHFGRRAVDAMYESKRRIAALEARIKKLESENEWMARRATLTKALLEDIAYGEVQKTIRGHKMRYSHAHVADLRRLAKGHLEKWEAGNAIFGSDTPVGNRSGEYR